MDIIAIAGLRAKEEIGDADSAHDSFFLSLDVPADYLVSRQANSSEVAGANVLNKSILYDCPPSGGFRF
jgi:hypothetical protein